MQIQSIILFRGLASAVLGDGDGDILQDGSGNVVNEVSGIYVSSSVTLTGCAASAFASSFKATFLEDTGFPSETGSADAPTQTVSSTQPDTNGSTVGPTQTASDPDAPEETWQTECKVLINGAPACTTTTAPTGSSTSGSQTTSSSSSTPTPNATARPTVVMAAGIVGAAGVLGVVIGL